MNESYDFAIVGGGIVGIATGLRLQELHPASTIVVLEKEDRVGRHQTGRNSGVIHAGVYYAPGSLKARFCRQGKADTIRFCKEHGIDFDICGKLIVATSADEVTRMDRLYERASANGIEIEKLNGDEARALEPNINSVAALLSPSTGIVDYGAMCIAMAELFESRGGTIKRSTTVISGCETPHSVNLETTHGDIEAGKTVFCAGLMSDRLARIFGAPADFQIVPFRGEYFRLINQPEGLVRHLIYPVPDPERPFLGVHLTRKLDGGFTVGPNAVLAMKREGYSKLDISPKDLAQTFAYPGFWRLLGKNFSSATSELTASMAKGLYLKKVQRYCSSITANDLAPYRSGIRAQAVARDGTIIDDFLFSQTRHTLHVCNAPSPAATAAFPIAQHVVNQLLGLDNLDKTA
ncbi:MAG: L-2-hydroxyglutarate oxidase [Pseudomonadota bacterium]